MKTVCGIYLYGINLLRSCKVSILEVTTTLGCRVACAYCPQELYTKTFIERDRTTRLSLDTLKTSLDNIPEGTLSAVVFSGYSEPFLNPDCTSMILHCLSRNLPVEVFTTMVGVTLDDIDRLRDASIKWVIHIPDNQGLTKIKVDDNYFAMLEKLVDEFEEVVFLFTHGGLLFEYVHPEVLSFLNEKKIRFYDHLEHSRAGHISRKGMTSFRVPGKLRRCWRLNANVLLPNGDVTLCCQDFGQKHLLGNLVTSDYESLFTSEEFAKVEASLEDESIDSLCRQCVLYSFPENPVARGYHALFRLGPPYIRMKMLSVFNELARRVPSRKLQKHINNTPQK